MHERRRHTLIVAIASIVVVAVWWWLGAGEPAAAPTSFDRPDLERVEPGPVPGDPWAPAMASEQVAPTRATPVAPPAGNLALRGRVLGLGAQPVAGAAVRWALLGAGGRGLRLRTAVRTGPDGTFAFRGSAPLHPRLIVVVRGAGYAPAIVERVLRAGVDATELGDITLQRGGTITGRVVGPARAPVPAATVSLRPTDGNRLDRIRAWRELLPVAESDDAGGFRFVDLMPGAYRLEAWAPNLQRGGPAAAVPAVGGELTALGDVVLARGCRLAGLVLDPDGAPRADAEVRVRNAQSSGSGLLVRALARTAADGRFALDHLPPLMLRVEVAAAGCLTWSRTPVDPAAGEDLRVELGRGLTLSGRVLDAVTGEPVTSFVCTVVDTNPDLDSVAGPMPSAPDGLPAPQQHPDGVFRTTGLDAGFYSLAIHAPGYAYAVRRPLELRPDVSPAAVQIRLARGLSIGGVVVDGRDGSRVAGARVELRLPPVEPVRTEVAFAPGARPSAGEQGGQLARTATTDAQGVFAFADLAPARLTLVVRQPGFVPLRVDPWVLRGDRRDLRLELSASAAVFGVVPRMGEVTTSVQVIVYGGPGRLRVARVGPDGHYRIDDLDPGGYVVRACVGDPRDYLMSRIRPATDALGVPVAFDVSLAAGEQRQHVATLQWPAIGSVVGSVRDDGLPMPGCRVTLLPPQSTSPSAPRFVGRHFATQTANDGSFAIEGVPVGDYEVRVLHRGANLSGVGAVQYVSVVAGTVRRVVVAL